MDFILYCFLLLFDLSFLNYYLFLLCVFIICFYKIKFIDEYIRNFNKTYLIIKNKKFNFKDFDYNCLNSNISSDVSNIFLSGFKELIILNRNGITDINLIINLIEKKMLNMISNDLYDIFTKLKILSFFSNILLFISLILTFLKFLIFFINISIFNFVQFNSPIFIFSFFEIFIPFFYGSLIAFIIKILYYKYLLVVHNINNRYLLFINEFVSVLVYKLFN